MSTRESARDSRLVQLAIEYRQFSTAEQVAKDEQARRWADWLIANKAVERLQLLKRQIEGALMVEVQSGYLED
jgi:hypothetical protein